MAIHIGKYAFNSKEQAQDKIEALGVEQDEEGNPYPTHHHTVVELGLEVLEEAVYEEGELVSETVFGTDYLVDVLWSNLEADEDGSVDHPYGWKSKAIDLEDEGVHGFFGVSYQGNKM